MESITKNRQSAEVLRAMAARAYGADRVPDGDGWFEELGHGWFNVAYRVRLRDGYQAVVKIAPPPGVEVMTYERGAMATELAAIDLITAHTHVPVPRVDFADHSRELCDADWFFMPFIDADTLGLVAADLPPHELAAHKQQLGALNREINTVPGPGFGPLGGPGDPSWRRVFTGMVEDVLADGERRAVDLGLDCAAVRELLAAHADSLDEVREPRLVEWDLWDMNVLVRDGRITGIIDHERAFYGDPLIESGFSTAVMPALGDAVDFMRGYGHPELTETQAIRRKLYNLYLLLVMTIETVYRGHTDPAQYTWSREQLGHAAAMLSPTRH